VCAVARSFSLYSRKSKSNKKSEVEMTWFCSETCGYPCVSESFSSLPLQLQSVTDGIRRAASLVDMPCSELCVSGMIDEAKMVMRELKADVWANDEVEANKCIAFNAIIGEELREKGFGGIYGVGKAASDPPALLSLSYSPPNGYVHTVVWAGKGIVYDTGGLSLKQPSSMVGMKRDMGGAAAILHGWAAAVRNHTYLDTQQHTNGTGTRLICVLCLAENAIGPNATRPDDILLMYSGKTVEVNNTDAEGRLVLADGVAFSVQQYRPDVIMDMCTLTGAQGISTGKLHAAIVCNDDELEMNAVRAGKLSGDLVHPLLYCPELFIHEFTSSVADMKVCM
jgi:probable aminopeptidase NPEPL1